MKEPKTTPEQPETESQNAPAAKKERKPRAKYITIAERFTDVPDVVWDVVCQNHLAGRLAAITANRALTNKELAAESLKLHRNEYENLVERGLWEAKAMSAEFLLIAQKKSNLPGTLRNYIETLLIEGMNTAVEHYRAIETKRANKLSKTKAV
jgi:hypothetical protein